MCTAIFELFWEIASSSPLHFTETTEVNSTVAINDFTVVLTAKENITGTGIKLLTTATNDMVTSNRDGQQVVCYSGASPDTLFIDIAGTVVFFNS